MLIIFHVEKKLSIQNLAGKQKEKWNIWLKNHSPCCVDKLLLELTVIDGVVVAFEFMSWEFASLESCRDKEKRRELKFATPLVTFATNDVKKLIIHCWTIQFTKAQSTVQKYQKALEIFDVYFHS